MNYRVNFVRENARKEIDASWLERVERQYGATQSMGLPEQQWHRSQVTQLLIDEIRHLHSEREDLRSVLRDNRWELGR